MKTQTELDLVFEYAPEEERGIWVWWVSAIFIGFVGHVALVYLIMLIVKG